MKDKRHKGTKAQRHKGTKAQRHKGTKAQRHKGTKKNSTPKTQHSKLPRGRPTGYKPEFCEKLIAFFDIEPYQDIPLEHYVYVKVKNKKTKKVRTIKRVKWTDYKRVANKLPTLRDFAKSINVPTRTVYDWLDSKHSSFQQDFSHAFTRAREIRKDFLIQNGLQGLYPPLSFKFVAVNLTDMVDKSESDHKMVDEAGEPLSLEEIERRIKEAKSVGDGLDKKSIDGGTSRKTD